MERAKIRLCVDHPLGEGQTVPADRDQANYLFNVMRLGPGDAVALFTGRDGEWQAEGVTGHKRNGNRTRVEQSARQITPPAPCQMVATVS